MSQDNSSVILYSYWRSSCSWRVRLALAAKGIKYEYKPIDLLKGEQSASSYTEINPLKEIPSLLIDGHVLGQSVAILEYINETRPDFPLLPKDPAGRAKVRQIVESIAGDTQPIQNQRVLKKVAEIAGEEQKAVWAKHWIQNGFEGVERILAKSAGKYSYGDEFTLADCCLIPQVYNAYRFGVDMSQFPTILRVHKVCIN
jgi:maleylacetoacetate isomerase